MLYTVFHGEIMGTCKKCGRSGLFVAVDKNGLCKRCRETDRCSQPEESEGDSAS